MLSLVRLIVISPRYLLVISHLIIISSPLYISLCLPYLPILIPGTSFLPTSEVIPLCKLDTVTCISSNSLNTPGGTRAGTVSPYIP